MGFLGMEIENKIEKETPDIPKQRLWGKTPDNPLVWSHWTFFPKEKPSFKVHCLEAEGRAGQGRNLF